jgi:hypothetical protein
MPKRVRLPRSSAPPGEPMTPDEFRAAIAAAESVPRPDEPALRRATVRALRGVPRVPAARVVRLRSPNGTPLPVGWDIAIEPGDVLLRSVPLPRPHVGHMVVVIRQADAPRPVLDEEQIAHALARALVAEVSR